ncbi:MAG: hypothetical protein A3B94_01185 [Candidatus Jacksonbacteria bacterium RIFCSPHIGHO2_02_FULL_43_10]|nr:MAG: hypothetical protein A3B94_01185 [Candidatus Jacksonbacteria bacterium RIFCSPHIGHO2_02_FULL_43_10]
MMFEHRENSILLSLHPMTLSPCKHVALKKRISLTSLVVGVFTLAFIASFQLTSADVTYSVSVDKTLVQGGSTQTYTFTIINGTSDNPIYNIKITKPTGFTVSASGITCPTNFGVNTDNLVASGFIECLGDPDPAFAARLAAGDTGLVTLSATAPTSDSTASWAVVTKDTEFISVTTNPVSEVDATTPTVISSTLITPNSGYLQGGASYDITWFGITDPHIISTPITLEYSALGDFSDTTSIATNEANDGTYTWTVPTSNLATAKVKITAVDSVGNSASDSSDSAFVIDSTVPEVNAGADVLTKVEITQDATVTDTNIGSYEWKKVSGPGTITFGTASAEDTTISASEDGPYVIQLTVVDLSGNSASDDISFVWDTTAPTVELTKDHDDLVVRDADTVMITATFNEAMSGTPMITIGDFVANMNESASSYTYSWDVPSGNDGDVVVSVVGEDLATNAFAGGGDVPTLTFTIDNTAPDAPVVSSPSDTVTVNAATYTISGTAEENALVKVYNGEAPVGEQQLSGGETSYSVNATLSQNTVNNLTVTTTDTAGNEGLSSPVSAITEDSIAPTITPFTVSNTVISPTVSSGVQDTSSIDVAFSETSDYTIKIKQGATLIKTLQDSRALNPDPVIWDGTNNSSVQVSAGTYTIEIIADDDANNRTTDTSVTITVDNTAPTIGTLVPSDSSYTSDSTPLISATLSEAGSGIFSASIMVTVDGDPVTIDGFADGVASYTPSVALLDGSYTVTVDVSDNGGTSAVQAVWSFTVDTTDPIIAIDGVTTPTSTNSQTISGSYTEANVASITVNGETADFEGGTYSVSVPLMESENTITANITDLAGRTDSASSSIVLDISSPVVNVGDDVRANAQFTTNATVTDATALTYQWTKQLGEGTITFGSATSENSTISSDTDGTFVIRLTATDAVGNQSSDDMELIWDATAPTVELTHDQSEDTIVRNADAVVITATFSETMASAPTISINSPGLVNNAPMAGSGDTWTYTWSVPSGNDGDHTVTVDGSDLAGNAYVGSDSLSMTIDNTAPSASEVTPVTNPTNDTTPNVVINVEEGASWVIKNGETELASGVGSGSSAPVTLSEITAGTYNLTLTATDTAGNTNDVLLTAFTIDTTAPTITNRTPSVGASGVAPIANITVTFSEAVAIGSGNVSFDPSISGTPVVEFDSETHIATINPENDLDNNVTYTIMFEDVVDLAGNVLNPDTSSWSFSTSTGYSITLTNNAGNGWNFISLPTIPASTAIADVLGDTAEDIASVWTYDAATESWTSYFPAGPDVNSLSTMTAGYGYWIKYTGASSATLTGEGNLLTSGGDTPSAPPSRSLPAGWNLVGYYQAPGTTNVDKSTAFQSLDGVYTNVLGFNNTGKTYVLNSNISTVNPGEAFWLLLQSSGVYSF